MDYQTIKRLAREHKVTVPDLIALARQNDPFYTGTKGDLDKARWFAGLWERFGYTDKVHLRRVQRLGLRLPRFQVCSLPGCSAA
jgi:hypothetical protein